MRELKMTFRICDTIEKLATPADRAAGFDLADYMLKMDYREFREKYPAGA